MYISHFEFPVIYKHQRLIGRPSCESLPHFSCSIPFIRCKISALSPLYLIILISLAISQYLLYVPLTQHPLYTFIAQLHCYAHRVWDVSAKRCLKTMTQCLIGMLVTHRKPIIKNYAIQRVSHAIPCVMSYSLSLFLHLSLILNYGFVFTTAC